MDHAGTVPGLPSTAVPPPQISTDFANVIYLTKMGTILSRPFFRQFAEEQQITLNEWRVTVVLAGTPEISAQEVGNRTGLQAMNVSRAVAGLRKRKRVTGRRDPTNHRSTLLHLTPAGWELFTALAPSAEQQAAALFSVLTADEADTLGKLLRRLLEQAERIVDPDPSPTPPLET